MSIPLIILLSCGGFAILVALFIIYRKIVNKKKMKKLQKNIEKFKEESKIEDPEEKKITITKDSVGENLSEEELFQKDDIKENEDLFTEDLPEVDKVEPFSAPQPKDSHKMDSKRDEDFEKFLDEHAYSRKLLDKPILEKIKKLPPEMKAIVLGNIFDKFDEDK